MELSHLDEHGQARMVDVSSKERVRRTARASGRVLMAPETLRLLREGQMKKGDAFAVARVAGIAAAKRTSELIPLCHNIRIDQVSVDLFLEDSGVRIETSAVCTESTGIEMEAAHEGSILLSFGELVPPFMNTALYATNVMIKKRPDLVRGFIKAWLETIAWARANRKGTVDFLVPVLNLKASTVDQVYARLMPTESVDGRFVPAAMATMRRAVVELGILDTEPDIAKLYTEEFLPKN